MTKKTLRIGTRGSKLALWQANYVAGELDKLDLDCQIELVKIQTSGDVILNSPLSQIGGQGIFTKEIQRALQTGEVDVAVHSLKDLPTFPVENLKLAAVPPRGPTGDAFLSNKHKSFAELPEGATVATSSLRRQAQILHRRPDLTVVDIRGNVETRLKKLTEEDLDAIILAEAGLFRLGLQSHITEILDPAWMLPAVGQGALGLESRADDEETQSILGRLDHPETHSSALAERALLRFLGGGCQVPIGAAASVTNGDLKLRGVVLSPDGSTRLDGEISGATNQGEEIGRSLAEELHVRGAGELLR